MHPAHHFCVHSQEYYHLKLLTEMKLNIGPLEANLRSVAELLLQTYYLLMGYAESSFSISDSCVSCLCDLEHFHYFRLVLHLVCIFGVEKVRICRSR